jgi:UDP-N-acetylglucosamine--N-acetylmuramyl-(pentapeptide) pyrophosphoryl-undecaprenol N-acetylglucosamine transferase
VTRLIIAGGGTGGHVFPGLAVAYELRERGAEVTFVGTARGLEARVVPEQKFALELLDVEPMKGGGIARAARGAGVAALAVAKATQLVRRLRPEAVLSVGGYAAGPVSLAAALMGVPLALYEPNAAPGMTNRWLKPFAKRAFVVWPEAERVFGTEKSRMLGVPLRRAFLEARAAADGVAEAKDLGSSRALRVLVLGGSQGAKSLNTALPRVLGPLAVEVVHQTGSRDEDEVRALYRQSRASALSVRISPFISDVAAELAAADLVIARSGASTVAEVGAMGAASILVPFPHAADNHQETNARSLERRGGCVCVLDKDLGGISEVVLALLDDRKKRLAMGAAAKLASPIGASAAICEELLNLATQ